MEERRDGREGTGEPREMGEARETTWWPAGDNGVTDMGEFGHPKEKRVTGVTGESRSQKTGSSVLT